MKRMAKQHAWEKLLRGSGPSSCWISGVISYEEIKYQMLGGYKMQLKVPNTKSCLLSEKHISAHTHVKVRNTVSEDIKEHTF